MFCRCNFCKTFGTRVVPAGKKKPLSKNSYFLKVIEGRGVPSKTFQISKNILGVVFELVMVILMAHC